MLKRVLIACIALVVPGFSFFIFHIWGGYSQKLKIEIDTDIRAFSDKVSKEVQIFNQTLHASEALLNKIDLLELGTNLGLPANSYDWESFQTTDCSGKVNFSTFRNCFSYIRKSDTDQRRFGPLYTWLRVVKKLSPNYYKLIYNDQLAETGVKMSPDIEGFHWLEFDQKQILFFYKFSEKLQKGFSVSVDPLKLWNLMGLSEVNFTDSDEFYGYQRHPLFSSARFNFEPDTKALESKVKRKNTITIGLLLVGLTLVLIIIYSSLRLFLRELIILGRAAGAWVPGKSFKFDIKPKFSEVNVLFNKLSYRSLKVLEQNKLFGIVRNLQSIKVAQDSLLNQFRSVLKNNQWNPVEKNFDQVLDLQGAIQALIDKTSSDSFNNLVNEIYALKKIFVENDLKSSFRLNQKNYVDLAAKTQELLLKTTSVKKFRSIQWDVSFLPGRQVAGDFFIVSHQSDYTYFCVADVAGKGLQAGLFGARIKAALDALISLDLDLEELFSLVNNIACSNKPEDSFCTCFLGRFNHINYEFKFCSSGHNNMYMMRHNAIQELSTAGLPFGLVKDVKYESDKVLLLRRDRLVLYTDGCIELENQKQECYSSNRFKEKILSTGSLSTNESINHIVGDLQQFRKGVQQADDMTLLVIDV